MSRFEQSKNSCGTTPTPQVSHARVHLSQLPCTCLFEVPGWGGGLRVQGMCKVWGCGHHFDGARRPGSQHSR